MDSRPKNRWLFLTWNLYGSNPDRPEWGPGFLVQELVAELVVNSLLRGAGMGHYQLGAFVIMANHVHALVLPRIHPGRFMKSLKRDTEHEANRILGRTGPFWRKECCHHWVRSQTEWLHITAWIERNPVNAGLVSRPEQYHWSSAGSDG